jgi:hypothetical protein
MHVEAGQVSKLTPIGGDTTSSTVVVPAGGSGASTGSWTVTFISAIVEDSWSTSYWIIPTGCDASMASVLAGGTGSCVADGYSQTVARKSIRPMAARMIAARYFFRHGRFCPAVDD